jgi:hypothetical protein
MEIMQGPVAPLVPEAGSDVPVGEALCIDVPGMTE